MSESLNRLLANLHAERVASWEPAALQVNIDQRQRLLEQLLGQTPLRLAI
jgi:hypothetical protein